jgi:hypothetical protein
MNFVKNLQHQFKVLSLADDVKAEQKNRRFRP